MTASRDTTLKALRARRHVPVLIIGAGINGAGLYRDLCLQGVDCVLCDRSDVCAGASAAPSRLIHGGLKYLETGEFRLVAQSTLERNLLLGNAPHYVRPLKTVIPIFSWFGGIVPSVARVLGMPAKLADRGVLITEAGLQLYDFLGSRERVMPRHGLALRRKSLAGLPALKPEIVATGSYYDAAVTQPERLGLELVLEGSRASAGSAALTHMAAAGRDGEGVLLRDSRTGRRCASRPTSSSTPAAPGSTGSIRRSASIGPISAAPRARTSYSTIRSSCASSTGGWSISARPTAGSASSIPISATRSSARPTFASTIPISAVCDDAEATYMLGVLADMFPGLDFTPEQIIYRYCGVRPLPAADAHDPGSISRDHSIREDVLPGASVPVLSLIGGKWTTFRGFAEEAADLVLGRLGKPRRVSTRRMPIGGGRDYPAGDHERQSWIRRVAASSGLEQHRVATLLERYGTTARTIAGRCADGDDRALESLPDYSVREIEHICAEELVGTLPDVVFRRTTIAIAGRLTPQVLEEIAAVVADACGWSGDRRRDEIEATRAIAASRHGIGLGAVVATAGQ